MAHALVLTCSPNGATSVSRKMLDSYLARRKAKFPDETLTVRDLSLPENALPNLSGGFIAAMFLPPEARTAEQARALELSDRLAAEFQSADTLIVATPIHNYTVPIALKAWIDHVSRPGVTFTYEGGVRRGLARARSAVFLLSSGGIYTSGPQAVEDFLAPYLRHMMVFFGIPDVTVLRAEGVAWDAPSAIARAEAQIAAAI
ncbi:MAG: NAD(P)H-dependent oxidoreductase [Azospirillum sp.]|nr:NAD(P)H-dependent oxidoreductase [Azospirillum sp.]